MNRPTIGILAGMGPKTTGPFVDQVISECQSLLGAKDDIDFPEMMIYALSTPYYIDRPIDHELIKKTICSGLKRLEACDVAFIAMPSNTPHIYYDTLKQSVKVPLLNIIDATVKAIPSSAKKIAILGTRQLIEAKLYQNGLDQRGLVYVIHPSWHPLIDELIATIKREPDSQTMIAVWNKLATELEAHGVDTVILACTDLTIIAPHIKHSFHFLDSTLCLAQEVVTRWKECAPH